MKAFMISHNKKAGVSSKVGMKLNEVILAYLWASPWSPNSQMGPRIPPCSPVQRADLSSYSTAGSRRDPEGPL